MQIPFLCVLVLVIAICVHSANLHHLVTISRALGA